MRDQYSSRQCVAPQERQVIVSNTPVVPKGHGGAPLDDDDDDDEADLGFYHYKGAGAEAAPSESDTYEYSYESENGDGEGFVAEISDGPWGPWAVNHSEKMAHTRAEYNRVHANQPKPPPGKDHVLFGEQCLRALEMGVDAVLYIQVRGWCGKS